MSIDVFTEFSNLPIRREAKTNNTFKTEVDIFVRDTDESKILMTRLSKGRMQMLSK